MSVFKLICILIIIIWVVFITYRRYMEILKEDDDYWDTKGDLKNK